MINIENFLEKYYKKNEKIILACSTWPDSMFLLYSILKTPYKDNLIVCYFNHKLRDNSDNEERFLEDLWKEKWFEVEIWSCDIKKLQKDSISVSIEELARKKRYEFLFNIQKKYSCPYIITAHHLDDKIETFFFNLCRWTKLSGLINMVLVSWNILRPLIKTKKTDILKYLEENNLEYKIDETNFEDDYTRNLLRNKIIPNFEKINNKYKENISNTIDYLEDIKDFIDKEVKSFLSNYESSFFSINDFNSKSLFLKKEIIRYIYFISNWNSTIWLTSKNIDEILKFIKSKWNKTKKEIKKLSMFKDSDKIYY